MTAGFQCEEHENPADFFLDVITHCENPAALENQGELQKIAQLTALDNRLVCRPCSVSICEMDSRQIPGY